MVLVVVLVLITLALAAAMISLMSRQELTVQLAGSVLGHELEHLVLQSLEEGHYLLAMGHPAPASRGKALEVLAAVRPRAAGPERLQPVPSLPDRGKILDQSANAFLRAASNTLHFAPTAIASSLEPGSSIELGPVETRVVFREAGKQLTSPFRGEFNASAAQLFEIGLPPNVVEMTATWGLLELRCFARAAAGTRRTVQRQALQRKLFAVVDYTTGGAFPRSYAYIFPEPVGQVVSRGN